MASNYYKPCPELDICNELINKYFLTKQYEKCFIGYLDLAMKTSYPLAECQVGYFYLEGLGCEKDLNKAFYWTKRSAEHGDHDGQFNLAWMYETGIMGLNDLEQVKYWYKQAAMQDHDLAIKKC